jgi:multidrug efflux pump subunit AcrA (membrane-fusion protein)
MHAMLPTLQPLPDASALGAVVLALLGVASEAGPAAAAECRIALGGAPVEGWTLAVQKLERSGSAPADCASSLPAPDVPSAPAAAAPAPVGVDAPASSSPEAPPGREARTVFALLGGTRRSARSWCA